jgi:gamma-glutamyltranspeptidase/glutathione hydrolase
MTQIKPYPTPIDWDLVNAGEIGFAPYASRRSVVYGTKGVVASSQPLATQVGIEILNAGGSWIAFGCATGQILIFDTGNAADAAVAVSAALNVTEPSCCGIGGYAVDLRLTSNRR